MDRTWAATLDDLVRRALSQPPPDALITACLEQAQLCDRRDDESVATVFDRMLRLAEHLWITSGPDVAERPLIAAMNVALGSYEVMGTPTCVIGFSKALQRRGLTNYSLTLLDHAVRLDVSPAGGDVPAPLAELQNHRGELLRQLGLYDRAEAAFGAALTALNGDSSETERARGTVLNNLGLLHYRRGDLAQAKHCLVQSLDIADRVGAEPLSIAITLDNLGAVEASLAAAAGPLWQSDEYINGVVDQHLRQAEEYLARARAMFEDALPEAAEDYVLSLITSADVAKQRGDAGDLDALSRRAWELSQQPQVSAATAHDARALRGEVLFGQGGPPRTVELLLPWFEELLTTTPPHERPLRGLTTLLRAAAAIGDSPLASRVGNAIAATDDELLERRIAGASETDARKMFTEYARRTELILGHCLPAGPTDVAPPWLYTLLLNRKGVLAERQGTMWLRVRLAGGAGRENLDQLRHWRSEVARLDLDGSGEATIAAARRRQDEAVRRLGEAEAQIYRELGQEWLARVSLADVQACLEPDTTLLDFTAVRLPDGSRRYVVFLVRALGAPRFRDLGAADDIDQGLTHLTSTFARPPARDEDRADWLAIIREIAPSVFEPGDVIDDHVIVAPTGLWGMAPVCLLPDAHGTPLVEDHRVTLVPSARWLATRATSAAIPSQTPGRPLVIGDPDFDLQFTEQVSFFLSLRFPRLEHAGAEAADVGARLGVPPAVRGDATRARLLGAQRPRILHIATHGVFLDAIGSLAEQSEPQAFTMRTVAGAVVTTDEDPLGWSYAGSEEPKDAPARHRSRVRWLQVIGPAGQLSRSGVLLSGFNAWLAGVDTSADVGIGLVSAGEFALLDLSSTEMVVLSACETGVGAVDYADGSLLGLRTAALAAGAACCVSTLWKVGDASTAALMSAFYRELAAGLAPGAALRAAQKALRDSHPDPYYWAGWVVEGAGY